MDFKEKKKKNAFLKIYKAKAIPGNSARIFYNRLNHC